VTGSVKLSGGARQVAVTGLTNGVRYVFTVTANQPGGRRARRGHAAVIPFGVAAAPAVSRDLPQSGGRPP